MKILVIGGSGLLGNKIIEFGKNKFDFFGTFNKNPVEIDNCKFYQLDITNKNAIKSLVKKLEPKVIIHTSAITNVDYCENHKEEAWKINVEGTQNLVEACEELGYKLVFLSSDYVFDGKNGPYSEDAETSPINYYGLTKLEGEKLVSRYKENLIVRTTVPYGWHKISSNFGTWVIEQLRAGKQINVVTDQYGTPTFADNFAEVLVELITKNANGIYNIVGTDFVNRYEFATKIAEVFNLNKALIKAVTTEELKQIAKRPMKAGLKTNKVMKLIKTKLLAINEGLAEMKKQTAIKK